MAYFLVIQKQGTGIHQLHKCLFHPLMPSSRAWSDDWLSYSRIRLQQALIGINDVIELLTCLAVKSVLSNFYSNYGLQIIHLRLSKVPF